MDPNAVRAVFLKAISRRGPTISGRSTPELSLNFGDANPQALARGLDRLEIEAWGLSHALAPFKMPATDRGLFAELQVIVLADIAKGKTSELLCPGRGHFRCRCVRLTV